MKKQAIPALIVLMLAAWACQFDQAATPPTAPPPSATPTTTLTPVPSITPTPTITPTPPLWANNGPALLELHLFDSKRGWGLTDGMILSTHDDAATWAQVPLPGATVDSTTGSFFLTADTAFFVAPVPNAQLGQFFATHDGGQPNHWKIFPVPFPTARLYFVNDTTGFAFQTLSTVGDKMTVAIYQTTDGGASWDQVFIHAANMGSSNLPVDGIKTGMSFIDANNGFIGLLSQKNSVGFYRSIDSGHSWAKLDLPLPAGLSNYTASVSPPYFFTGRAIEGFVAVDFTNDDTGAVNRVYYATTDTGVTWTMGGSIPDGGVYDFLDTQTAWAWGKHTIYFTSDAAKTWTQLPVAFSTKEHATIIDFVDKQKGWLLTVDTDNSLHLYTTADGGNTWTVLIY